MGTRGAYGFYKNGKHKVTYNHFDSYPSYLGKSTLTFFCENSKKELERIFKSIALIDKNTEPSEKDIKLCMENNLYDGGVDNGKITNWYCLLRNAQGDLNSLKKAPIMIDSENFLYDSLFCEWAYIINLSDDIPVFEVYRGFNKDKNAKGRYVKSTIEDPTSEYSGSEYYGVSLIYQIKKNDFLVEAKAIDDIIAIVENIGEK